MNGNVFQRLWFIIRILGRAFKAFWEDNVMRLGASVAYYTLFAIAPILIIVIAVAGAVFGDAAVRGEVVTQLDGLVGNEGARAVQALLQGAARDRNTPLATIIGIVTLTLAATGAFLELQSAFNTVWRAKADGSSVKMFLISRVQALGLVVAIGFLLLVSLTISAALGAFGGWLGRVMPGVPIFLDIANILVSFMVIAWLFALLFRFLPDTHVYWHDAIVGAVVTTILFSVGKQLIGFYLGRSATASVYGTAGSVVLLLLWVYYTSQIVLIGAEFTRLYGDARAQGRLPQEAGSQA